MLRDLEPFLVAEGNTMLRHAVTGIIENEGFKVISVSLAEKLLELLKQKPAPFSGLLLDLELATASGQTRQGQRLLREIKSPTSAIYNPHLPIFLWTNEQLKDNPEIDALKELKPLGIYEKVDLLPRFIDDLRKLKGNP